MPKVNGRNQHRANPILVDHPDVPDLIQKYLDDNAKQIEIPEHLTDDHAIEISLRAIQRIVKDFKLRTARQPRLGEVEIGVAILEIAMEDPLGRWGARLVKEKLARQKGVHIPRDYITAFRRAENPEATAARHPVTRKIHSHGLWSIGPNEEWCVDGHEKILKTMKISVWGVIDKFSRMELGLYAVPNARVAEVPPMLYLSLMREHGGMPLTTTCDKGSELSTLVPMVTSLRKKYQPYLDEDTLPAVKAVTSTANITRERNWGPIWHKELANVLKEHDGPMKLESGFHPNDPVHEGIRLWLWGAIVQLRLNNIVHESRVHRIRYQKDILLPSGGRRLDFYRKPKKFGGEDQLIAIPIEDLDDIMRQHYRPEVIQFGTNEMIALCDALYEAVGSPLLSAVTGWDVFSDMVNHLSVPTPKCSDCLNTVFQSIQYES